MKSIALFILVMIGSSVPILAQPSEPNSKEKEEVLAWYQDEPLTASDLEPDPRTVEMNRRAHEEQDFVNWLESAHTRGLTRIIFGGLLEEYRRAEVPEPTGEEIDQFIEFSNRAERESREEFRERLDQINERLKVSDIDDAEKTQLEAEHETLMSILDSYAEQEKFGREHWGENYEAQSRKSEERIARQMISSWKTNRSLFDKYGGRVIFQQAGPEPVDAYRRFLEEHREDGDFEIMDPTLREAFWKYFVNDRMHTFYDLEEGASWMQTPWWMRDLPAN